MIEQREAGDDTFLQEDLERTVKSVSWKNLQNSTVLVSGATGLIGSLIVKTLLCSNRVQNTNIKVLAMIRSEEKARKIFGNLLEREKMVLFKSNITAKIDLTEPIDYIIHCASITASKIMISNPVDVIQVSVNGTQNLLELAKEKSVKSMVYLSSMEVYGTFENAPDEKVTEDMIGYINPLKIRSNYPESKRLCENLCVAYAAQYNVPVKIARLAQTFGAGILPGENRVFAQFARSAMMGTDIVLHTLGQSEGNYCYTSDAISAILQLLSKGENGQAYNVTNEANHITIADMAHMVADNLAVKTIRVIFDIPENNVYGYACDTKMHLDASRMMNLGWEPQIGLLEAYRRLIGSMKIQEEQSGAL